MADVRSLLRNERAQRRITHPQASYTATGTLECTVCHIPLKSDQEIWSKHLKSTQHAMRQERLRLSTSKPAAPASIRESTVSSKKRKADDGEEDSRKKTKPVIDIAKGFFDETAESADTAPVPANTEVKSPPVAAHGRTDVTSTSTILPSHPAPPPISTTQPIINEDEWAAFERDVATPPPDPSLPSVLTAEATISAAPLTAAELAAQAREQANQQMKERREAEAEGEKEDAARALEEEFDEMEGLEERVARLRRMREEIRARREVVAEGDEGSEVAGVNDPGGGEGEEVEESDDEEEEEDLYGWGGLGR